MSVYYITIFAVFILAGLAQALDRPRPMAQNPLQICHTQTAGFFFFWVIFILVFVAGFRYRVGTDYGGYYLYYRKYAQSFWKALIGFEEPGYPLISKVAIWIHDDGATAIFLASLVMIWPALRVIYRHSEKLVLPVLLYIFLGCWHGGFNGVRQYLAATMLFCGYEALEGRNLRRFLLFVFLAFLFHRSAIVMAALYFAVHQKISTRNLILLLFGSIIVFLAYDRVLTIAGWITENEYTLDEEYTSQRVNILRVLVGCAPAAVFLWLYWKKPKTPQNTFCLNLLIIHAAMRIATMSSALLYRIGIYTTLFQTIAIPELLKGLKPATRRVLVACMVPLFAFFWWYEVSRSSALNHFRWIWKR